MIVCVEMRVSRICDVARTIDNTVDVIKVRARRLVIPSERCSVRGHRMFGCSSFCTLCFQLLRSSVFACLVLVIKLATFREFRMTGVSTSSCSAADTASTGAGLTNVTACCLPLFMLCMLCGR